MTAAAPFDRLLVDVRPVDHPTARGRGIGRYTTGLIGGLVGIGAPVTGLYATDREAELIAAAVPDLELRPWSPPVIREHATPGTWFLATELMLHPITLDPIPAVVTGSGLPVAAIMHDVIPYRYPDDYLRDPNARVQARLRAALSGTVDVMLSNSAFSADTAADELHFPRERIHVIGAGVESRFVPPPVRPAPRPERVLPADVGTYVVAVTGGDDRKNTHGLLRGWAELPRSVRDSHRLVVATAVVPAVLDRWRRVAADAGVADEVVFTGHVTDREMVELLQGARLAVMPSFEEGFGLPLLEAAACGCPSVCSGGTSLVEVIDEPAAWFDPVAPSSIAGAIERALTDDDRRSVLADAAQRSVERFTWERAARETVTALATLGPRWPRRVRRPDERLALAGPFEGSTSGIGRYDVALVAALRRTPGTPAVDVLVDGSGTPEPTRPADGRLPLDVLGRYVKPWDYDHIVAVLGSSPHHVAAAELALAVPSHVWLHDATLVGVYVGLGHASGSSAWAIDHARAALGAGDREQLTGLEPDVVLDAPRLDALGVRMLEATLARARSVIVSSERAAAIVREVRPEGPPVLVLPHPHPPVNRPPGPPSSRLLVAPGWLAANKAPDIALEVLARLPDDVRLRFAGPATPETEVEVSEGAAARGLSGRVEVTGWLDGARYTDQLAGARVGLQLRTADRGEMSGAIADLASFGIPTVTTLSTAAPSSAGVRLVALDVDEIVAAIVPLLDDDELWRAASADALARAAAWTFDDVAAALLDWVDDVPALEPGTIRRLPADAT